MFLNCCHFRMIDSKMGLCVLLWEEWDGMGSKKHIWVLSAFSLYHVAVLHADFVAGRESSLGMWRGKGRYSSLYKSLEKNAWRKPT